MEPKPWPADFVRKKADVGCPQCELGRVDETEHDVPRHDPDPAPSMPLPAEAWIASRRLDDVELEEQLGELRAALAAT